MGHPDTDTLVTIVYPAAVSIDFTSRKPADLSNTSFCYNL